mmetsp:Transcript_146875/g.271221  ORF Transcript_146875/g.271221 Transcript_146875/m.271221 type:complete len:198 (+) Transcript_146875:3-596(+)
MFCCTQCLVAHRQIQSSWAWPGFQLPCLVALLVIAASHAESETTDAIMCNQESEQPHSGASRTALIQQQLLGSPAKGSSELLGSLAADGNRQAAAPALLEGSTLLDSSSQGGGYFTKLSSSLHGWAWHCCTKKYPAHCDPDCRARQQFFGFVISMLVLVGVVSINMFGPSGSKKFDEKEEHAKKTDSYWGEAGVGGG